TRLDTPPLSIRRHPDSPIARSNDPKSTVYFRCPERLELCDIGGFPMGGRSPSFVPTFSLRLGNAFSLTFEKHFPFEFSYAPEHRQHKLARGRSGVDAKVQDSKAYPLGFQAVDD